jgi:putative transposase
MYKSYKYKLLPNAEQQMLLNKHFGCVRFVYNHFLNERIEEYKENKNTINYYDNAKSLTGLKRQEDFSWLKEVNSQTLQYSLRCLDGAYQNFFKFKRGFPKFKSKKSKNCFSVPASVKVEGNYLNIPKFKNGIKFIKHRDFKGDIKSCTISKTPTNEYFVSLLVETTHKVLPKTGKTVGIDLGLKDFVITSDGEKYKNNRYTKTYARKLKVAQQHLSKKQKDSNRYQKQRIKAARVHQKITNSRLDNLHKVSTDLIRNYDVICIEDLNVKGMIKNHKLSKHIADASWGKFVELLTYKAKWNERELVKIDRFFPSSKSCNNCGYINQNLKLSDREWTCNGCGKVNDRDFNAAKNILSEGLKLISAGTVDYRRGDEIRPPHSGGTVREASKVLD